jgi:hypothetical protein
LLGPGLNPEIPTTKSLTIAPTRVIMPQSNALNSATKLILRLITNSNFVNLPAGRPTSQLAMTLLLITANASAPDLRLVVQNDIQQ